MKTKLSMLTAAVLLSAGTLFGQESAEAMAGDPTRPADGKLLIRNNSRYSIGGVRISRAEALALTAPYPDVTRYIKNGATMKYVAIGLGVAGSITLYTGFMGVLLSSMGERDRSTINGRIAVMAVGGAMTWTSVGLAIGSKSAQRKAMRLYNGYVGTSGMGDTGLSGRNAAYLSLGTTDCGGIGLQLRF